jgi:hypothetical protein
MNEIEKLISAYLDEYASDQQVERLFAWVREKPENAAEFARFCALHADLREHLLAQRQASEGLEQPVTWGAASQPDRHPLPNIGPPRADSNGSKWEDRIAALNRFLVAAVVLLTFQMSWGALTVLELCRPSTHSVVQEAGSFDAESSDHLNRG